MKKIITAAAISIFTATISYASNYDAYREFIKGMLDLKAGQTLKAQKDYEKVISLDQSALPAYQNLAYMYLQTGNKELAYKAAKKVDELDGNNPQTAVFLGTFYAVANDSSTAKDFWDKTLQLDPDNETAMVYLASHYSTYNDLLKSADYWNKFLKQQPDSVAGYLQLALVQEKLGQNKNALKSLDKAVALNSSVVDSYMSKARIYESEKKFDLAIKEYKKYIEVFPDNPFAYIFMGRCYLEINDLKTAEETLLAAKEISDNADALKAASYWLGTVYEKEWKIPEALKEFEYVSSLEENVILYSKTGYFYSLLKEYAKAEKQFQKALKKEPSNVEVLYMSALNYLDWAKYDKALNVLKEVSVLSPDFADAYFFMAAAYEKKNDYENSEKALLKVIELNPENAKALNHLGYIYADRNIKFDRAQEYIERALKIDPKNGAYVDSLGWLYFKQGKYELSKQALMAAASMSRDPLIYDHLGDVCKALGRFGEAWVSYVLSYDMKRDATVKEKLDAVQKELPKEELYKQMLLRSESNFLKVFSVKAGWTANFSSGIIGKKTYVQFSFVRGESAVIEIPGNIMGGAKIYIKDGEIIYEPKALETAVPKEYSEVISFAAEILSKDFYRHFSDAQVTQKGKKLIYKSGEYELVLDIDTAYIEKITKGQNVAELSNYGAFAASWLPKKIVVRSGKSKAKASFETKNFTFFIKPAENKK
ncbi:tetratricopeptide repeat protein [Endomicrobium proavitum]|uniref:Uncharacterized protein n=1 Tax=Endomicrobium proavitum TaxID=1408281 RepID=A0A0G3WJW2_9BACT|nr:tetratricopeptide repeat protein [Endomicrobium proavitum]AKL98588.1 exported protein of unknown function [Endomicrobium proavitum]